MLRFNNVHVIISCMWSDAFISRGYNKYGTSYVVACPRGLRCLWPDVSGSATLYIV